MAAQTTEGTGPGSATNIKHIILNGDVMPENITLDALVDYQIDINASGSISAEQNLNAGGDLTVDQDGSVTNLDADGYIRGYALGQTLNTSYYTFSGSVSIDTDTDTDVASVIYSPRHNNSFVVIEFHAPYTINGGGGDAFRSRLTVDGNEITYRTQTYDSSVGTGTRSSICFPISHVYTNNALTNLTIKAQAKQATSDDTMTVDKASAYMKITEISRG